MSHNYDGMALYQFLNSTPEQGLRRMLIEGPFTIAHFNMLLKMVRSCKEDVFASHFEKGDFPKLKFNPTEISLKENFWDVCINMCNSRGILLEKSAPKIAA